MSNFSTKCSPRGGRICAPLVSGKCGSFVVVYSPPEMLIPSGANSVRPLYGDANDKAVVVGISSDFDLDQRLRCSKRVFLATAFARKSGWHLIRKALLESKAEINIVTGLYCCHTQPELLWEWLDLLQERQGLRVSLAASPNSHQKDQAVFHPKVLIVQDEDGLFAIVGSGNLTSGGLRSNVECSIYTDDQEQVSALLAWFQEIECVSLSKKAILKYELQYKLSAAAQKAIRAAQKTAEEAINLEITFRKRSEALEAAKAYFSSSSFLERKAKRSAVIPTIRTLLDFETFNFDAAAWTTFYKKAALGKIREAYLPSTVQNIALIREGMRFLFDGGQDIEHRLPQLLEKTGKYHVKGVGLNLISKFLAAHDPKAWFVFNKQVATSLDSFGYRYSGKGGRIGAYIAFVKAMRGFRDDSGAEDCVALDSFFSYWYGTYCKAKAKPSS